jgi:3-dehydroquinate dehydratase type I
MDLLAAEGFAENECQRQLPCSKILTVRDPREGGGTTLTESERLNLFARFLPHVDYIDVELRNFNRYSGLLSTAKSSAKQVIVSVHDFERTPSIEVMEQWIDQTVAQQPSAILKIATQMTSWEDLVRLGNFLTARQRIKIAAMGMGHFGKISRLLFAQLGSELLYAACGKTVVPGQWDFQTLRALLPQILDSV